MKRQLLKRVIARVLAHVGDPDMSNTFPSGPPLKELEEAASGSVEIQPHRTLRERNYGTMPLIIRPDYSREFLKKLREPFEGKIIQSDEETSLQDFSAPDGLLKHQEEPVPRILLDDYYEMTRPGEDAGGQTLKEYWDRGWDEGNVPEVSEDRDLRNYTAQTSGPNVHNVMASYLLDAWPIDLTLPNDDMATRVAKTLADLKMSKITTSKGTRSPLDGKSVSFHCIREQPNVGKWTYATGSGSDTYTTVFQFIPKGNINNPDKLQVRVSCSCNSWVFWGAQYNAHMSGYLDGPIRLNTKPTPAKFSFPKERDPTRQFLCCKHVLACIPDVSKKTLGTLKQPVKVHLMMKPELEIKMERLQKKLPIPLELKQFGMNPGIHNAVSRWKRMDNLEKKNFIDDLHGPGEVAYMGHALPDPDTMKLVIEKLTDMSKTLKDTEMKNWATDLLKHWLGVVSHP